MTRVGHFGQSGTSALWSGGRWQSQLAGRAEGINMTSRTPESEPLLTPAEVATMFRVDPKTVTRWAKSGKLTSIRTLGGHRRYRETEVRALLAGIPAPRDQV
jgi:excisionase family DNA binding protein